jgi:putative ABC transport system ATP-binding protein
LADEPTGNLDSVMGNEIMDILLDLNQNNKTTIVMVTHDETMAQRTNRLIRLFDGSQVL